MVNTNIMDIQNIGFVSTRIRGTDGVSLEIGKWADILQQAGYNCYYVCGNSDRPADRTFLIEEADFSHPGIMEINRSAFGSNVRSRTMTHQVNVYRERIKDQLYRAVDTLKLDAIIAENALTIPMNIPLGLALMELILETGIPCLAHHHDFVWERERFLVNCVEDFILAAFPPALEQIDHVVINTVAAAEFSRRQGLSCRVIPNVMDFEHPPVAPDAFACTFRQCLGIEQEDLLILQPTRIVHRKGIEHTIELVRRLNDPRCKLVVTHESGDEGHQYFKRVTEYARLLGVEMIFAQSLISHERGRTPAGKCTFSIWDAYASADLVTYPSTYEGFGNAFLEAVYFRKPVFCNRYSIFRTDIEPCGLQVALMDGFLTDEVVDQVRRILNDREYRRTMVETNYEIGSKFFSFQRASAELGAILGKPRPGSAAQ